jgi:hypothetical protein
VYRLGLSPRRRPAESLAVDEWWIRDLADELGVGYPRFKEWAQKGYVHTRRVGRRKHLVIWAETVLRSRLFFADDHIGNRVLAPVEYVLGAARTLELFLNGLDVAGQRGRLRQRIHRARSLPRLPERP